MLDDGFQGSFNEWDPLREVIVGSALQANVPPDDIGQRAIEHRHMLSAARPRQGPFSDRVIEETEEDLSALVSMLETCGVSVRRPAPMRHDRSFGTTDWHTEGFHAYCPRDTILVLGDTIVEAPMVLRSRQLEVHAYRDLLLEYFRAGANWISAPRPRLLDEMYSTEPGSGPALLNGEPAFDAANVLRAGRDLFYLVSDSGNEMGADWLQRTMGREYRVHKCRGIWDGVHIDSTIGFVRPGLVVLNGDRVSDSNLPPMLRPWDKIWCADVHDIGYVDGIAYSSQWIGMNFLMVRPDLAVVDQHQMELIGALERYGVEVLPTRLRHARTLGGGLHCVTLDVSRSGTFECYFN